MLYEPYGTHIIHTGYSICIYNGHLLCICEWVTFSSLFSCFAGSLVISIYFCITLHTMQTTIARPIRWLHLLCQLWQKLSWRCTFQVFSKIRRVWSRLHIADRPLEQNRSIKSTDHPIQNGYVCDFLGTGIFNIVILYRDTIEASYTKISRRLPLFSFLSKQRLRLSIAECLPRRVANDSLLMTKKFTLIG